MKYIKIKNYGAETSYAKETQVGIMVCDTCNQKALSLLRLSSFRHRAVSCRVHGDQNGQWLNPFAANLPKCR